MPKRRLTMPVRVLKARVSGTDKFLPVLVDGGYDGEYFAQFKWRINAKSGHVSRANSAKPSYLSSMVLKPKPGYVVWHKNRNLLDNRSENLEYITPSERALRRKSIVFSKRRKSATGFRYVSYNPGSSEKNPYYVKVKLQGKLRHMGSFPTAESAARFADEVMIDQYGYERIKGVLNFPEEWRENGRI